MTPPERKSAKPLLASFSLVALMELGDKTQIIAITLAAQFSPFSVFVGMIFAFAVLTGAAVLVGAKLVSRLPAKWLKIGTSALFIVIGAFSIIGGALNISLI